MGTGASALSKEHRDGSGTTVVRSKSDSRDSSPHGAHAKEAPSLTLPIESAQPLSPLGAAGGGLAARRKVMNMQVNTTKRESRDSGQATSPEPPKRRTIKYTERFADFYTIGTEVMPSTNTGMEVRHARRLADRNHVVIKVPSQVPSLARTRKLIGAQAQR